MSLENGVHASAELKIREADDARADTRRAVVAARAHRGDAVDEFRLSDGRERGIAVGAVHGVALDEDRPEDIVTRLHVLEEVMEQVAIGAFPEVMMGIDDRQFRLQDRFRVLREPLRIDAEQRSLSL